MCVGYGIDDDNIDNDKDIGCTEFTTTWKIHLILFFKVWAKGRGEGQGSRAEGSGKPRHKIFIIVLFYK